MMVVSSAADSTGTGSRRNSDSFAAAEVVALRCRTWASTPALYCNQLPVSTHGMFTSTNISEFAATPVHCPLTILGDQRVLSCKAAGLLRKASLTSHGSTEPIQGASNSEPHLLRYDDGSSLRVKLHLKLRSSYPHILSLPWLVECGIENSSRQSIKDLRVASPHKGETRNQMGTFGCTNAANGTDGVYSRAVDH